LIECGRWKTGSDKIPGHTPEKGTQLRSLGQLSITEKISIFCKRHEHLRNR